MKSEPCPSASSIASTDSAALSQRTPLATCAAECIISSANTYCSGQHSSSTAMLTPQKRLTPHRASTVTRAAISAHDCAPGRRAMEYIDRGGLLTP